MHADGDWETVEGVLSKDMVNVSEYPQTWKLQLSTTKTVLAAFHLNNKEAKRELKVNYNRKTLPFCSDPNTSEQPRNQGGSRKFFAPLEICVGHR